MAPNPLTADPTVDTLAQMALMRIEAQLTDMAKSVADVRERVARMETNAVSVELQHLKDDNARLWERVNQLEADRHARDGSDRTAQKWGEWIHRLAPWAFAVALAVWNYTTNIKK